MQVATTTTSIELGINLRSAGDITIFLTVGMCPAISVVRHDISEQFSWPQHVADIFRQLSRPLPKHLASDVFQTSLPLATREILQDALQSPTLALEDIQDVHNEDGRPVVDVIDSVLTAVRMVKAASSFGRRRQQARISWTSLIAFLGITVPEDVFIACGRIFRYIYFYSDMFTGKMYRS